MKPLISVIIPVYKVEQYLPRCLESVLNQTYDNLEIILVDDGSPDNCGAMCDGYANLDWRVRVIHKSNGGQSDARNAGINMATGDYVSLIDSDDYIALNALEILCREAVTQKADVVCFPVIDIFNGIPQRKTYSWSAFSCSGSEAMSLALASDKIDLSPCSKLFKTELLRKYPFPVGVIYEDAAVLPMVLYEADRVSVIPQALYYYDHRDGSTTMISFDDCFFDIIKAYEGVEEYIKEHCPDKLPLIDFRLAWSRFIVLDKMIRGNIPKQDARYQEVVSYLKSRASYIRQSRYFNFSRKLGVTLLQISDGFYRFMVKMHQ